MEAPVGEPAIRRAAVLITHWDRRDIEAVVLLLAELGADDSRDTIIALLVLKDKSTEEINRIVVGT